MQSFNSDRVPLASESKPTSSRLNGKGIFLLVLGFTAGVLSCYYFTENANAKVDLSAVVSAKLDREAKKKLNLSEGEVAAARTPTGDLHFNVGGGEWGGTYKCPSGAVYEVGDVKEYGKEKTLAGRGGEVVAYHKTSGPWSGKSVICKGVPDDVQHFYHDGCWGGKFKCPSGVEYDVCDVATSHCDVLEGKFGTKMSCNSHTGGWNKKRVVCGNP